MVITSRKSRKAVQDLDGRQARSFGWAPDWGSPHTPRREALGGPKPWLYGEISKESELGVTTHCTGTAAKILAALGLPAASGGGIVDDAANIEAAVLRAYGSRLRSGHTAAQSARYAHQVKSLDFRSAGDRGEAGMERLSGRHRHLPRIPPRCG